MAPDLQDISDGKTLGTMHNIREQNQLNSNEILQLSHNSTYKRTVSI